MILSDTVHLALRNLRQSKLRTTLTAMGVSIGIASLTGMVSLGVGIQDQVVGRLMKSGVFDSVTVLPPQTFRGSGGLFGRAGGGGAGRRGAPQNQRGGLADASGGSAPSSTLDDNAIKQIAALPEVKEVYPVIRVPVEVRYDLFAEGVVAMSVPMTSKGEGPYQTMSFGSFFDNDTDNACMLSLDMAKQLTEHDPNVAGLEPKDLIGKDITLVYASSSAPAPAPGTIDSTISVGSMQIHRIEAKYRVAGIFEREQGGFAGGGTSGLMLPLARAKDLSATIINVSSQSMLRGSVGAAPSASGAPASSAPPTPPARTYQTLTVKVAHPQASQEVEDKIKGLGYSAFSLSDALTAAKRGFIILDILLSLIGSIALAVSSLGIVNTMVMSILERTREIGIMKAVGGSDADVRGIFLVEASSIGILGGVAGVAIGWFVGRIINFGANRYIVSQGGTAGDLFSIPLWLVLGSIGFAIVVSLIAGSYPARRAARLDPIQALRHD